jgi:hypothetical protein
LCNNALSAKMEVGFEQRHGPHEPAAFVKNRGYLEVNIAPSFFSEAGRKRSEMKRCCYANSCERVSSCVCKRPLRRARL